MLLQHLEESKTIYQPIRKHFLDIWVIFSMLSVDVYLDSLARHGVPRGFNGRIGAGPVGQRWRKWSHHYLLLIGQTEKTESVREGASHAEVSERRRWGLWALGTWAQKETVIGCSVSHYAQNPNFALFLSSSHVSVMTRVSIPLMLSYKNANTVLRMSKKEKTTNKWSMPVHVCVWKSSTYRRFGLSEKGPVLR